MCRDYESCLPEVLGHRLPAQSGQPSTEVDGKVTLVHITLRSRSFNLSQLQFIEHLLDAAFEVSEDRCMHPRRLCKNNVVVVHSLLRASATPLLCLLKGGVCGGASE